MYAYRRGMLKGSIGNGNMTASTTVFANTLAMQYSKRLDAERLRRIVDAPTVEAAFKMLGDYGYSYTAGNTVDKFIVEETDRFIAFIADTVADRRAADALIAPFWYNNVKLAYKSRFIEVPSDAYYQTEKDATKIADGEYDDADVFLSRALEGLDEEGESKPQNIDIAITRAMYKYVLSCGVHSVKKYFRAEIDLKNILTAARLRRLGIRRAEFIDGGKIALDKLEAAVSAESFSDSFNGTPYEQAAERIEENGFSSLGAFERDADDFLYFMTDSPCAAMTTFEPFLNYYALQRIELKTIKTALVCIKTDTRDTFFERMPKLYD